MISLAGGALSVVSAAGLSMVLGAHRINVLISYAIGALLGAAFLEILPHALEQGDPHRMAGTILFGIMLFFLLEKLVLWRHCHHAHCEAHEAPVAFEDALEAQVAAIWGDVLQQPRIGPDDNFIHLGGDSLTALAMLAVDLPWWQTKCANWPKKQ